MNHAGELQTARSSARLGLTLRLILLAPGQGFDSALMGAERRDRAAQRPAEGYAPYLLAAVGGAALFLIWLKIGALSGLRDEASYRLVYLVMALGLGAILGLVAQALWGLAGGRLFESHRATPRNLRLVWGLAAFPNVVTLSVLLPLDLVVVGPAGYTAARLADPVATAWAAFSIALGVAFAVWSAYLFVRGVKVAAESRLSRLIGAQLLALAILVLAFAPPIAASRLTT